jgi:hypothetical protein
MVQLDIKLDSKGISNALYGLQSMSSNEPQIKALLAALANSIKKSESSLSGQGIGDSLFGLTGMSTDCPELRALLSALCERIDAKVGKLDSQEIGNALYGLQGMSSDHNELQCLLRELTDKVTTCKGTLRGQQTGNAFFGLQRMTNNTPEVANLLDGLAKMLPFITNKNQTLEPQDCFNILFGKRNFIFRGNRIASSTHKNRMGKNSMNVFFERRSFRFGFDSYQANHFILW